MTGGGERADVSKATPELLPCPFCGGKAVLHVSKSGKDALALGFPPFFFAHVRCTAPDCRIQIQTAHYNARHYGDQDVRDLALTAWNRRVANSHDAMVAALDVAERLIDAAIRVKAFGEEFAEERAQIRAALALARGDGM